ncbi:Tyrocidine synthase 3 [Pseudoalteromonas holothuriae]|uniref:Tyrocidine synthase 3 n=1 Tax=Pseudoalteromonas holothuriae TaxID=2963714 RepID=A0ABN8UKT0_9GAMM|nr:non-ribosomal peptide synthetase [Pseudoalteromonas sp. CIP111951]CAH9058404.1 Tyrocidine synthase 3 [Pseudoalteromonas sp. CIP111951]
MMDNLAIESFLAELDKLGIYVYMQNGALKLRTKLDNVPSELLSRIKKNKDLLIEYMSQNHEKIGCLSSAQQRIWFISQYEQSSYAYNMSGLVRFSQPIHAKRLNQAINLLLSNNEVLKSNFISSEEGAIQKVCDQHEFAVDVAITQGNVSKEEIVSHLDAELTHCFDLANDLLVRGTLFTDNHCEHGQWLYIAMHHIIADGWSVGLFIQALLEALTDNQPPQKQLQYLDYVHWEQQYRLSDDYKEQLSYWQDQLVDIDLFELPTSYPRSAGKNYQGSVSHFHIDNQTSLNFSRVCQTLKVTEFVGYLSIFYCLLYRYSQKRDITLGVPVLNRSQAEFETMIGCFINTLPIRLQLKKTPTFTQLAQDVMCIVKQALANQSVALEDIITSLNLPKSSAHSALFQVLFNYNAVAVDNLSNEDISADLTALDNQSAKYDLTLNLTQSEGDLIGSVDYCSCLFDSQLIEAFCKDFVVLVDTFTADCNHLIDLVPLPSVDESSNILQAPQAKKQFISIVDSILNQVTVDPNQIALRQGDDQSLTYDALEKQSAAIACAIVSSLNVAHHQPIAILVKRSINSVVAMLGVMRAKCAYLPIEQGTPFKRILEILNQAQCQHLVIMGDDALQPSEQVQCVNNQVSIVKFESLIDDSIIVNSELLPVQGDDCAYVMFTSGSTGSPKGVMISHQALASYVNGVSEVIEFTAATKAAVVTGLATDLCLTGLYPVLANGGSVLLVGSEQQLPEPQKIAYELAKQQANLIKVTPSFAHELLPHIINLKCSNSVKHWIFGGEALTEPLVDAIQSHFPAASIVNHYGPTETCIGATAYKLTADSLCNWGSYSIGQPFSHVQIKILNEDHQGVPVGMPGELYIGGSSVALGYINAPSISEQAFVKFNGECFYRSGDQVRLNKSGQLEFLGRLDDQIKVRGFRVDTLDIEAKLNAIKNVKQAVVLCQKQAQQTILVAHVVTHEYGLSSLQVQQKIKADLKQHLPEPMIPSVIVVCDLLPLLANGKVDRNLLKSKPLVINTSDLVLPNTVIERQLASLFEQLTGAGKVGIHDDFFAIGGHSLLAMKLLNKIQTELAISITLKAIFANPTVAELAQYLEINATFEHSAHTISRQKRSGQHPLSYAQQRLWIVNQLQGHSSQYNLQGVFTLHGEIDSKRLEQAFDAVIQSHRILRFNYRVDENSHPVQFENTLLKFALVNHDLTSLCESQQLARVDQTISSDYQHSFDLSRDLMIRAQLIKLQSLKHVLIVNMHHIVSDGWSIEVLCKALSQYYSQTHSEALSVPDYSYIDYVYWQRENGKSKGWLSDLEYWRDKLSDLPKIHELPTDYERLNQPVQGGALFCRPFASSLSTLLRQYVKTSGHTLFLILQTVFSVWLSRASQQADVALGTAVSGRELPEFETLIGNFINTLVLYSNFNEQDSFNQAIASAKNVLNEAIAHQQLPFDLLVDELSHERNISIHPLIQIVFRVNNQVNEALQLEGLKVDAYNTNVRSAKLDLEVSVIDKGSEIVVEWLYDTALWQQSSIERFFAQYCHLLEQCLMDTDIKLSELAICSKAEQSALLNYAQLVEVHSQQQQRWDQRFSVMVKSHGEHIALRDGQHSITYTQLEYLSNQLAHSLLEMEFAPQSPIGVLLPSCVHMVLSILAISKANHVYVPLHIETPSNGIINIVDDAQMMMILALSDNTEKLIESGTDFLLLDDIFELESNFSGYSTSHPNIIGSKSIEQLCYIIYTSGSTGKPKGVTISHANVNAYLQHACESYLAGDPQLNESVVSTPLAFDATVTSLIPMLLVGGTVNILTDGVNQLPLLVDKLFKSNTNLLLKLTPAHLRAVLGLSQQVSPTQSAHTIIVGGEALTSELVLALQARLPKVRWINEYGPTETTVGSSTFTIEPDAQNQELPYSDVPIGLPISQVGMLVVDKFNQVAAVNMPGELLIAGPVVSPGYLNQVQLNKQKFIDIRVPYGKGLRIKQRFYRTGDVVRWHADGENIPSYLRYIGRCDDVVKLRGYRVDTNAICHHMLRFSGISECSITLDKKQALLCAHYITNPKASIDENQLKDYLSNQLLPYMVPSKFNQLERMPLTRNGKIDAKALQASTQSQINEPQQRIELKSLNTLQAYLLQLFSDVLNNQYITLDESFFELGGHSLLAIRLISEIRCDKHYDITLEQLFKTPSVLSLSQALAQCPLIESDNAIAPIARTERLPLSYAQQRLWLIEQVQSGTLQYHMPASFELKGTLHLGAFNEALKSIIERHEVLRSTILSGGAGESPEQLINEQFAVPLKIEDLSALNTQDALEQWLDLEQKAQQAPFNLSTDVLIRVLVVKFSGQHYRVHFNMHHIASDGWSMAILVNEFIAFYRHYSNEPNYTLASEFEQPFTVQYADFAYWQRQVANQVSFAQSLDYWQTQLKNYPVLHQLPIDKPRPTLQQLEGDTWVQYLSINTVQAIHQYCKQHGLTLFMWLHSVFSLFVMRFSQTSDVLIGSPIAGREQPEVSNLIGFFVNTLVIRAQRKSEQSFEHFLQQQKQVILDAFKHQAVPFEQLVETLQPERDLGHQPLFQILFALQNNEVTEFKLPHLQIEQLPQNSHQMKFDLEVNAIEREHGIELQWNFATSLFKRNSIKAMACAFATMIDALLKQPLQLTSHVPLNTKEQQIQTVNAHTHFSDSSPNLSLLQRFNQVVNNDPNRTAVVAPNNTQMSFIDLQQQALQLASYLRKNNLAENGLVAICLPASSDMVVAMLAAWHVGCAYVPIDPKLPAERFKFILQDAQASCLVTSEAIQQQAFIANLEELGVPLVWFDNKESWQNTEVLIDWPDTSSEALAYVIYTSGTTGQPKGVEITQGNVALYLAHAQSSYLSEIESAVLSTPLAFDASVTTIWAPLLAGMAINIIADDDTMLDELAEQVFDNNVSVLFKLTPAHLQGLLTRLPVQPIDNAHKLVVGGEALSVKLLEQLSHYLPNCYWVNEYGPTEATVGTSMYSTDKVGIAKLFKSSEQYVPIGRPIENTQLVVLDEHQQCVPAGVVGELYVGGHNLANGYLGLPVMSAEKFVLITLPGTNKAERFYRTGDKVRWLTDEQGIADQLQFYGRYDLQVKLRGYRIELGDIEHCLSKLEQVQQAYVLLNHEQENLAAFIVPSNEAPELIDNEPYSLSQEQLETLRQQLAPHLPHYMLPHKVIALKELPLTSNGKVDTVKLQNISHQIQTKTKNVAPRNELERNLVDIFSSLLGVASIGVTDGFFALGGHSLLATQCVAIIKEQLGIDIPVKVLFERPTIAALSQWYAINQAALDATPSDNTCDTSEEMFL